MRKKALLAPLFFFFLSTLVSAGEIEKGLTVSFGLDEACFTDMNSVLSLHEGLKGQIAYRALKTAMTKNTTIQLFAALTTGILWEGETNMDYFFHPQNFPVFLAMEPGIKLNCALGDN